MGGIAVDAGGRNLDAAGRPIPGLRGAGCTADGLEGCEFSGLAKSAATAFRAADDIAGDRTQ